MSNLAEAINLIKPKYQDNNMTIYFNHDRIVFKPTESITVIKNNIGFIGKSHTIVEFGNIGNPSSYFTDLTDTLVNYYTFDLPSEFFTLNLNNEILNIFNSIASCGYHQCNRVSLNVSGRSLNITAYSLDFAIRYLNDSYFISPLTFSINSVYDFTYYVYILGKLFGDKKTGLSLRISRDDKYLWINCGDIYLRIEDTYSILNEESISSLISEAKLKNAPSFSEKKLLSEIHGTRLKHLSKCFPDTIEYRNLDKCILFSFDKTDVILTRGRK